MPLCTRIGMTERRQLLGERYNRAMARTNVLKSKVNKEILEDLYWRQMLSLREIEERLHVPHTTLERRMGEHGIPTRSKSEALRGNKNGVGHIGWNRGLTKKDHSSLKSMAQKLTGRPSPRLGTHVSPESLKRIAEGQLSATFQRNTEAANQKTRALWADPEWKTAMLKKLRRAFQKKPNRLEQRLLNIFMANNMPYEYVGDGKVVINGLIPDFINTDGDKKIIELFGEHWHSKQDVKWHQTELGRIMAYNSVGFDCLIIWTKELRDEAKLLQKIQEFAMRKEVHHASR